MGNGLGVLVLGQRVDRPELLATASEPLDAGLEVGANLVAQRRLGRHAGGFVHAEPLEDLGQLAARLRGAVPQLLGAHLGAGDRLAGVAQARLHADLGLCARAQLGCGALGDLLVGLKLAVQLVTAADDGCRGRHRAPLPPDAP